MAYIYAMGDIHGELDIFRDMLGLVDLTMRENKLILLGDYIDRGPDSRATLYYIKKLCERHPGQVIALRGNHEQMLLEQLFDRDAPPTTDAYFEMQSYLTEAQIDAVVSGCPAELSMRARLSAIYAGMTAVVRAGHAELLSWLKRLPYYYETERQIFVHAGVDEEAEEYWKIGSSEELFIWKFPHSTGHFYKDVIAGHIHTSTVARDETYHRVYWDGASHFYVDGNTNVSGLLPLLKYDTATGTYTSFEQLEKTGGWTEYMVNGSE